METTTEFNRYFNKLDALTGVMKKNEVKLKKIYIQLNYNICCSAVEMIAHIGIKFPLNINK